MFPGIFPRTFPLAGPRSTPFFPFKDRILFSLNGNLNHYYIRPKGLQLLFQRSSIGYDSTGVIYQIDTPIYEEV